MHDSVALTARLDDADRLVEASAAFLSLNGNAGGEIGDVLAIPPLATLVRLTRRLAIPVSRPVTIADGDTDLECWVRARPADGGTTLSLTDLRERQSGEPRLASATPAVPPPGADWTWEVDQSLVLRAIDPRAAAAGVIVEAVVGEPLARLFTLMPDDAGGMPLLEALGRQSDFDAQRATIVGTANTVSLSGVVRRDLRGRFAGFAGGTFAAKTALHAGPGGTAALIGQLDRALRPPIARIVAYADSMNAEADGPLDPHYVDYAADIASAGRHLLSLVDDLADLNAIERPDFDVAAEPLDLADLARRAAGLLAVRAADAEVSIRRPAPEASVPATGEFRRVLQILVNLLTNALRYAPRGSIVRVDVGQDGGFGFVCVADEGKGIAPEDQARIFEKFERVDTGEPGGSGLGLYIARRLARAMQGDLAVESAPGRGARFTLTLPAR